jgi:ribose transport system substrate-binding protein
MRSIRTLGVALLLAAFVIGCGRENSSGKRRIAVVPKGTTHDFWKSVRAGAEKAGAEAGVEIIWKGTPKEEDKEEQARLVSALAAEGVDGICIAPIDRTALVQSIEQAKRKGVPTVVFDSGLDSDQIVSYVATDNRKGGEMAGHYMAKLLGGKGKVVLLRYAAGSQSTEEREAGFLDAIKKHPDIQVISDDQRAGSNAEEALRVATSLLSSDAGQQMDAVFTVCEPNNAGMLQALENANRARNVKFVGFDSVPRFVAALRDGRMHGIVLQDPFNMGYQAVKTMVAHLDGQKVEKVITTGEFLATLENMDQPRMKELLAPPTSDGSP